jgi:glutathione synthase/RimK-type ligase-like ATP-grasp enzyme
LTIAPLGSPAQLEADGDPGLPSIVIATNPDDSDSFLVAQALEVKGAEAKLIHFSDFPSRATASLYLSDAYDGCDRLSLVAEKDGASPSLPETLWWRRPGRPVIPDDVHPDDRDFIRQETTRFIAGLWHHLPATVTHVNSPAHALLADNKPYQLRMAREVGFCIPPTLFSNDPFEIRSTIRRWGGQAIYKAYGSDKNFWVDFERQRMLALFTTAVDESSLPDDETLRLTPGIFQPLLPKAYELRLTVFGSAVFAAKIFSQDQEQSRVDWRNGQRTLRYEATEVSETIENLCVALLRRLGLLMGCFDLVVTPEGDVIFLEVNEGGQFLWLEPSTGAPLLDAFSDFLIAPRAEFRWQPLGKPVRLTDVEAAASARMLEAEKEHLAPEPLARFDRPFTGGAEADEQT